MTTPTPSAHPTPPRAPDAQPARRPYVPPTLTPVGQLSTLLRGISGSRPDAGNGRKGGPGPA